MDMGLRQKLYQWRAETAEREGVELFRVLPTAAISEILVAQPKTIAELVLIKGIKEAKASKYGQAIIDMVNNASGQNSAFLETISPDEVLEGVASRSNEPITVSRYLDRINRLVQGVHTKVVGEIGGRVDVRDRWTYFSLRDKNDQSVLSVMVSNHSLMVSGVTLEEGLEIAVTGSANIYKPSGRFTFMADIVEYVGEGALKKAYEELKKLLTKEGLFALERKRDIPEFPERIGVISSKSGAVIHDFQNNLGHFGYTIRFMDSRVEGAQAVPDILSAMKRMEKESLDVLVLIRGGGSMESLQAFNNEAVIRAVTTFPVPVITGIGHDKDVPLVCLASDAAPSTPTACAVLLNRSWNDAARMIAEYERTFIERYGEQLISAKDAVSESMHVFETGVRSMTDVVDVGVSLVAQAIDSLSAAIERTRSGFRESMAKLFERQQYVFASVKQDVDALDRALTQSDPRRQLKLGYSIIRVKGKVLRSVAESKKGDQIAVEIADGTMEATITEINPAI